MSLFECTDCGVIENTALGDYHMRRLEDKPVLCSQCSPSIGKWHGEFQRVLASDTEYLVVKKGPMKGTLEPKGGWK